MAILLLVRLALLAIAGGYLGAMANWAIYRWAWNPRSISPWSPPPSGQPQRTSVDRIPIVGWFRLRRESGVFGRGFWVRPLLIEICFAAALPGLYWWGVIQLGLILGQVEALVPLLPAGLVVAPAALYAMFVSHTLLLWLMVVASFIDIDEKIIPDEVTVPGTLLGLLLTTCFPVAMLPHVTERGAVPDLGVALLDGAGMPVVDPNGDPLYVEPVTAAAPNTWPAILMGAPNWRSLIVALGCFWLWCFALAPRVWRGRRGALFALWLIARRVCRETCRPPLAVIWVAGSLAIATVYWWGGTSWTGLLSALLGMVGSGGIVWGVRIIGSAAMGREAMGFGDVTLMMMVGAFLGWQAGIVAFFLAPLAGLVVGLLQLAISRDDVIPYGPYLCLAVATVAMAWAPIWIWAQPFFRNAGLVLAAMVVCFALLWLLLTALQLLKKLFLRDATVRKNY